MQLLQTPHTQAPRFLPWLAVFGLCGSIAGVSAQLPEAPYAKIERASALNLQQAFAVYPRITLNGMAQDEPVGFFAQGDTLYANHAALQKLGVQLAAEECPDNAAASAVAGLPQGYFPLASCDLVKAQYSAARQSLALQVPVARLNLPMQQLGAATQNGMPSLSRPDFSAVYNYDASISGGSGQGNSKGLYSQIRLGTPWGFFESNHVQTNTLGKTTHQRMDTFWRSTWPDHGITLTLGDTYTSQLTGSSGARMGGVQVASSYNTRPWYQKLPQTLLAGSTEMPSTVDLYLNGIKQYSQDVNAGPYEMTLPPTLTAGAAQVVTRDALGRQTVVDVPLYDTAELLAPGLQEWSVEAGTLRLSQGGSKQYDNDVLMSASLRRGLLPRLTAQIHAETKRDYRQAGLAFRASPGFPTQLGGQASVSEFQNQKGHQFQVFAVQQGDSWSVSLGGNKSSAKFASLGDTVNRITPFVGAASDRKQAYVQAGWSNASLGSFSLGRIWSREAARKRDAWTASWNKALNPRVSLMANTSYDERDRQQRSATLGVSVQLDRNINTSAYVSHQAGENNLDIQAQKSVQGLGDWGWSLGYQENNNQGAARAGVQTNTQYGDGNAQIRRDGHGQSNWQGNWRGGMVLLGGKIAPTRSVYDSFAVVSTNGVAGVPISVQNQYVGNTDSAGKLFVPNLMAFQNNLVAVDSTMLPANMQLNQSKMTLVPYEKSGSKITFNVQSVQALTLILKDSKGQAMPMGASILSHDGLPLTVVGYDGQVYLDHFQTQAGRTQTFRVVSAKDAGQTQECRFSVEVTAKASATDSIHDFGAVTCQPTTSH
jgi:outer membrane usher protein